MKINEFRFIRKDESFIDQRFVNWSRCYEWGYSLDVIKQYNNSKIHNTCCGPSEIHKQFHDSILEINQNVVNSDLISTETNLQFKNFKEYDFLNEENEKYDIVLCISTLEDVGSDNIPKAFNNLLNQLNDKGRLIITCDYPMVSIELLEGILKSKCQDFDDRLNGKNSVYSDSHHSHLNVILIDIEK
jgi:hypothetical protein